MRPFPEPGLRPRVPRAAISKATKGRTVTRASQIVSLSPRDFDAVLFDLDGVLTRTATVHARAWKRLFDEFLRRRTDETGSAFVPFDLQTDYRRHVDGKARHDGVVSFLASRDIHLPQALPPGTPGDSVASLGARKDGYFLEDLALHGVEVYDESIQLVRELRSRDVRTAVVSSSRNCAEVLDAAGIAELFDIRVDGNDLGDGSLRGKPAPDSFLEAAHRLSVEPAHAVVVEDAIAGVAAARAGQFGLVIGVDRTGQSSTLREAGADVVVASLAQVQVAVEPPSGWSLIFDEPETAAEGIRESLCALGNGYFTTRGAATWATADGVHYPGTYLAGGYNRLTTDVAGRVIENEDLVNLPNWLPLCFRLEDGGWLDPSQMTVLSGRRELDLRRGLLIRNLRVQDSQGRRTRLCERRLVSMADMHLAALETSLTPENWSGELTVSAGIDGRVVNDGAALYDKFSKQHLVPLQAAAVADDTLMLRARTSQSALEVAMAVRTRVSIDGTPLQGERRRVVDDDRISQELDVTLAEGQTLVVEKVLALHASRDAAISNGQVAVRKAIVRAAGFRSLMAAQIGAWRRLWRRFDIQLEPVDADFKLNVPMLLRLNIFHLLQAMSPNSIGLDIGVPARGWTGEAYQGHIFWDELFIFPIFNHRLPEVTRSLLLYPLRRQDEARAAARQAGFQGAMFPWQSASDGQEETQQYNLNWRSGRWVRDNSYLQRHVGSAIAYNVWQYFQVTHDLDFMQTHGAELILEIARFWSSAAVLDESRGRYEIRGVVGPDEFHEAYPGTPQPGLANNAYTNLMGVWVLCRALDVLEVVSDTDRQELVSRLGITRLELARWEDISRRMLVPFHDDGIISQFEGYERLRELDWDAYRERYGNIQRLDLILEAEGDSGNNYKLSKQADVLMLFYLFSAQELRQLLSRLGYEFGEGAIPRNVAYYATRCSHGSTLSRVVMSWVLARSDRREAMRYFADALQSDVSDIQQGTTAEGVHLGAMAGTVDLVQRVSTGLEVTGNVLRLNPQLPPELKRLGMRIRYRGHAIDLRLTADTLTLWSQKQEAAPIAVAVGGQTCLLESGTSRVFHLGTRGAPQARPRALP